MPLVSFGCLGLHGELIGPTGYNVLSMVLLHSNAWGFVFYHHNHAQ